MCQVCLWYKNALQDGDGEAEEKQEDKFQYFYIISRVVFWNL